MAHTGLYYDGRSAAAHHVEVSFEADALRLMEEDRELARWRYAALRWVSGGPRNEVRLMAAGAGDARLVLSDPGTIAALKTAAPQVFRGHSAGAHARRFALWAAASLAVVSGTYFGLPHFAETVAPLIPLKVEAQMGAQSRETVTQFWTPCEGTKQSDLAKRTILGLVHRLTKTGQVPFPITVDVVNMGIENAFALPGGHIILTRDLIDKMQGPDELAGVLAHELGHVAERHGMIGLVQQMGLSALTSLLIGGGSNSGEIFVSAGATLSSVSYTRRLEARADDHALAFLAAAKISPKGFADFFERLEKEGAAAKDKPGAKKSPLAKLDIKIPAFLSTHPPTPERAALARRAKVPGTTPALTAAQWNAVKAVCTAPPTDSHGAAKPGGTADQPPLLPGRPASSGKVRPVI